MNDMCSNIKYNNNKGNSPGSFSICFHINILFSELISWQTPKLSDCGVCEYVCACLTVGVHVWGFS